MTPTGALPPVLLATMTALVAVALLAGCVGTGSSAGADPASTAPVTNPAGTLRGEVVVLAATSLTESFTELGGQFEARHPGTTVTFSFAASSELATQVTQGAPADVFASASPATMDQVTDAGLAAAPPEVFVRNTLEIAVPPDNPGQVTGLADLGRDELTIALCAPDVPCGAAAEQAFAAAGVVAAPDTLEPDVKSVLGKVLLGEVDGGLVYRTDVLAAGDDVRGIPFPEAARAVNDYPIAPLAEAPNPRTAMAFVTFVRSAQGASVLRAAGFQVP